MSSKILMVDDDENILAGYQRTLRKQFAIDTASSGAQGLARLNEDGPYAVVVADMQMPNMNGIEFLKLAEAETPDTVRVMLTGNADQKTAVEAVNHGHVFRFLNKPCKPETFTTTIEAALRQHQLITAERQLLEDTLKGSVKVLTDVLAAIDSQSFGRARHVQESVRSFLQTFKVERPWELEIAALLAPIGRVTLPPTVLMKERSGLTLTVQEKEMLVRVPEVGAELIEQIPRMENVAQIIRFQHKCFDGTGFPAMGPSGTGIPLGARVLQVLNGLAELEHKGVKKAAALHQMLLSAGRYDPEVLTAASRHFELSPAEGSDPAILAACVRVQDLKVGQVLAANVETVESMLVVVAGTALSPMLLERLRNFAALGSISSSVLVRTA